MQKIGIIGLGFVGDSIYNSFLLKNIKKKNLLVFDKYKNGGIGSIKDCLKSDILFLCLPTLFNEIEKSYDINAILDTCTTLESNNFKGIIVIKSTVEPGTTNMLSEKYEKLKIIHNPEFLSAKTALNDFHNQTHIVIGKGPNCKENEIDKLEKFYLENYPNAEISICSSSESESMKLYCNSFYSIKVQFFTELYLLCQKNGTNFDTIKNLMLKNNWINPMHTQVPGPDGQISYGGLCFPKDTNALNEYMKKNSSLNSIINSCIYERNLIRSDNYNIEKEKYN